MGDEVLVSQVMDPSDHPVDDVEALDDLTLEQDACICGQPFGSCLDLDRSVEIHEEQGRLSFTYRGPFFVCVDLGLDPHTTVERHPFFQ